MSASDRKLFKTVRLGLTRKQNLIGALIGCIIGGTGNDWVLAFLAKRKGGYFKPEYRLWCLIPVFIFGPIGILLWSCGLGNRLDPMVAIAGVGITYAILCAGAAISLTYVVDSYRAVAGEGATVLIAFRNSFAFGISFGVFPWVEMDGFNKVSQSMAWSSREPVVDSPYLGRRLHGLDRRGHLLDSYPNVHLGPESSSMDEHFPRMRCDALVSISHCSR